MRPKYGYRGARVHILSTVDWERRYLGGFPYTIRFISGSTTDSFINVVGQVCRRVIVIVIVIVIPEFLEFNLRPVRLLVENATGTARSPSRLLPKGKASGWMTIEPSERRSCGIFPRHSRNRRLVCANVQNPIKEFGHVAMCPCR